MSTLTIGHRTNGHQDNWAPGQLGINSENNVASNSVFTNDAELKHFAMFHTDIIVTF